MEVILLHDVDRLGLEGEVVRVSNGYARNYLIPRDLAMNATKGALRDLDRRRQGITHREDARRDEQQGMSESLHEYELTIHRKSGAEGKLHGSVSAADIAARLQEETGIEVDKSRVELWQPIRQTGSYLVSVRLHRDVRPQLVVNVETDATDDETGEAPAARGDASLLAVPVSAKKAAAEAAGGDEATEAEAEEDEAAPEEETAEAEAAGEEPAAEEETDEAEAAEDEAAEEEAESEDTESEEEAPKDETDDK